MPCYPVIYTEVLTCRKEHIFCLKIQVEFSFTHSRSISNCCRGAILVRKAHHVTWNISNKELTALISSLASRTN